MLGAPRQALARLASRLRARDDTEHEQALIRIGFALAISAALVVAAQDMATPEARAIVLLIGGGVGASFAIFLHICISPAINPRRRLCGMAVDVAGLNAVMYGGGVDLAAVYPILLWVIFGHGFRFGRAYLFAAAGFSLVAFGLVVTFSDDWRQKPALDLALAFSLVVLPAYVARLLRQLEEAKRAAEAASEHKSRFLAAMSHELRTPLMAITGMSDLLRATELDREQRDMASTIGASAWTLLRQVDETLDIAKIEAQRDEVVEEVFDLDLLMSNLRSILHPQARAKGLHLRLSLDPDLPERVRGGARLLSQALSNLIGNAIKYTDEGGVIVALRAEPADAAGRRLLRFDVHDTGVGMSAQARKDVFERFERVGGEAIASGAGLGLAIAKELVGLIGGRIGVDSALGGGSTFWIEAAFEEVELAPEERKPLEGDVAIVGASDGGSLAELAAIVARTGARALEARDLESALEALERAPGRRALLFRGPIRRGDALEALDALTRRAPMEPIDLIVAGADASAPDLALAEIAAGDAEAARKIGRALRAALAPLERGSAFERPPAETFAPARVLVVDDNATNRKVIGKLLERAGHRPSFAQDGFAALEAIDAAAFDVVLMDLNMPAMDGFEALAMIALAADDVRPKVIALSADATAAARRRCAEAGFDGYLAKPVATGDLLTAIEAARAASAPPEADRDEEEAPRGRPMSLDGLAMRAERAPPEPALAEAAAPFEKDRAPILDPAKIAALRVLDGGDGFFDDVVGGFLEEGGELCERLRAAWLRRDVDAVRDLSHALASAALPLGGERLASLCGGFRDWDEAAMDARASEQAAALAEAFEAMRAALEAALRSPREGDESAWSAGPDR